MTQNVNENEAGKQKEEMHSGITEGGHIDEEIDSSAVINSRILKAKKNRRIQSKATSRLQNELRRHSDARKRTDTAIKDLQRQLKDVLLVHHAAIRDLRREIALIRRKISTIDSSENHTSKKTILSKKKSKKTKSEGKKVTRN
jgi:hypothetical protein